MAESVKKYGILLVLLGLIVPANLLSVELYYGVNFIFGTFFVFLIAFMYPPLWSLLAGAVSSLSVFFVWNHFFATPLFMGEAFAVALLYHIRKKGTPVEYVSLFWIFIGIPLGLFVYKSGIALSWETAFMTIVKQFLNSLFLASLAGIVFIFSPVAFLRKRFDSRENLIPLYEVINSIMVLLLLGGILCINVLDNRANERRAIEDVKERLIETSDSFITYMEDWKSNNSYNIYRMSYLFNKEQLGNPDELQRNLEFLAETLNNFDSLCIGGKTGSVIAYAPPVSTLGENNLEKDFSEASFFNVLKTSLKTEYTDIMVSEDMGWLIQGIAAPIRVDGQFEGFVLGAIYLEPMSEIMNKLRQTANQDMTLIDASGRIIISTSSGKARTLFETGEGGIKIPRGEGVLHWFPDDVKSSMKSFEQSKLYYKSAIPDLDWTLYIEETLAHQADELTTLSLRNNSIVLLLILLLIPLFKIILYQISGTLEKLIHIGVTEDLSAEDVWPETRILEFHKIIEHFQSLMELHNINNRQIKEQNRTLKKINTALTQSEDNLRITLQSIGDGVLVTNQHGAVTDLNPVACRLIGWSHEAAVNRDIEDLLPIKEELTGAKLKLIDKVLHHGESLYSGTPYILEDPQGKHCVVTIGAEPIRTSLESEIRGAVIVIRNISENRRLEEQLRQSQKLEVIGQLSGGIAHDFNNLLTGILGLNKMIKSELPPDSPAHGYSESIDQQITRAADLTNKLLAFSRKGKMVTKVFNIHEVIDETVGILERTVDKTISIEKNPEAVTPYMNGDPVQIQSVLMNIALNARDAMPKGGHLTISTLNTRGLQNIETNTGIKMITGPHIKVSIRDTGAGMDKDVQSHIFEPFFTTKKKSGTSGMSLSAVYGAVSEHNGVISVSSKQGKGTVFDLYFPIVKNPETVFDEPDNKESLKGDESILVIDDEEIIRNSLKAILTELGYLVFTASGGREGLEIYRENSRELSLIILDSVMADMPGLEVLKHLKEINPFVQVIIATGFSSESNSDQYREAGAADFIGKPFSIDDLNSRIRKILNK